MKDGEQKIGFSFGNTQINLSGIYGVLIGLLLVFAAAHLYVWHRHLNVVEHQYDSIWRHVTDMHRQSNERVLTGQRQLHDGQSRIYDELRIQTTLMTIPQWQRPEVKAPPGFEQDLKDRIKKRDPRMDPFP